MTTEELLAEARDYFSQLQRPAESRGLGDVYKRQDLLKNSKSKELLITFYSNKKIKII